MPRQRLGTGGRESWHQLRIGCIVVCWPPSKLLGAFIGKESHRRDGMLPFVEGCQLRRWTGIADRTRAGRLEHSLHRQDGGKGTITNHREANANGKPYMADTDVPNKLEPRIESGTCRSGAWNCADRVSKFQHVIRKSRSVGFQGPSQRTGACRARAQTERPLSPSHSPVRCSGSVCRRFGGFRGAGALPPLAPAETSDRCVA
jgi:hypothetical protein